MLNMRKPPSLVFLFLLPCFMASLPWSATNNITTDKFALLAFKSFITSDPYNFLANWSVSSSPCNWVGITCNTRHGRVCSLNLGDMGLTGIVSSQLGNLSFLVELDLSNNNFHSQIPEELVRLRMLRLLNLSYNELDGEIPTWIGDLSTLQHLSLCSNRFSGFIPLSVCNLSRLEILDCSENLIEGTIPFKVGRLMHLKILQLAGNKLTGIIPPTIFNLSSLGLLSLASNTLSGGIPDEIGNLPLLSMINLSNNQLSGSIPTAVFNSSMLQDIALGQNHFSGSLPANICFGLPKVERLNVENNDLSGEMPSIWHQCKELAVLELNYNRFDRGIIPSDIGNLTNLQVLDLSNNNLQGEIPPSLYSMPSLRMIFLDSNQLYGSLPKEMCHQLPSLELFSVVQNQLDGNIPKSISNCTSLKTLYLGANKFTGFLPKEIGSLDKLESLAVALNNLNGPIPLNIFNISTLTILYLGGNSFHGLLPSYLGTGTPNLKVFSLGPNKLTGQIPNSISNASKLIELDLSRNKFSGAIPNEIGNLSNLVKINLDRNGLNGSIPTTINKLQDLQYLRLCNNRLLGTIIDELCQIKSLSELYLANNMFWGMVPECLGNTSLRKLDFSFNKLTSHIPSSLWTLNDILFLDLSSNALNGRIPLEVSNLRAITILNLSRNQISGNIPRTMGGLQTLLNLSLAHNKFHGPIPESFGGMISIEFLDLSHNYLSGVIPMSLESLAHLKHINLSYNLLHGQIPDGGPFQNFIAESFMMNEDFCGKPQLHVQPCKKGNNHESVKVMLLIKFSLPIMAVILVVSCIVFLKRKRDNVNDLSKRDLINLEAPIKISYYELLQGTNGFDESNLLGLGSFGLVYKAILLNGKIVAVKVFNSNLEEALRSFVTECATICNLRHRNLIKVISSYSNDDFKSLIMEFMSNGSLDKWLYAHNYCLDMMQRLNIMIDVATALEYLHHGSFTPVVHCDVKPSNVLLDEDMVAHLSDFGIAKLLGEGQLEIYTETWATIGYMAPEYGSKGAVSFKGDVYSYGILLMEMLTRKKPTDDMFDHGLRLIDWVSNSIPHSIFNILDANLLQGNNQNIGYILPHISSIFELALNCCTNLPEARPNMIDVVVSLKKIKVILMQNVRCPTS